jgi:GntR family transcriptional repressor for pyruvate dehydrogenase complex
VTEPLDLQPIARRNTYELVADQLVTLIAARRLNPGDPLPTERELTQAYGVGRSSIREALRMLESRGVIQPGAARGTFVVADVSNPLHSSLRLLMELDGGADIHDIFELRRILECETAALAADRRQKEHLRVMDESIAEMEEGLKGPDPDRYIDADLRFHLAIAEATGNRVVVHSMQAVRDLIRRALMAIFVIPQSPERSLEQHRAIRAAIGARNSDLARKEMRSHLVRVESDVDKGAPYG